MKGNSQFEIFGSLQKGTTLFFLDDVLFKVLEDKFLRVGSRQDDLEKVIKT
jgi:hypothetical protein